MAVTGPPNAGKSTLINALMGKRLLITSKKNQTTRQQLRCILTGDDYQIIFVDTPGLHQPKNKLGEFMQRQAENSAANSDVILHVLDATKLLPDVGPGPARGKPVILALNKCDSLAPAQIQELVQRLGAKYDPVLPISAATGHNLDAVLAAIRERLPTGDLLYPADQLMDCDYRLLAAELIREQALLQLEEEVPHGVAVEIVSFDETDTEAVIAANVIVERDSHKAIVIGRGGSKLKAIGTSARLEITKLMAKTVHLKLWVKVKKNWRKDANQLKWLGYR